MFGKIGVKGAGHHAFAEELDNGKLRYMSKNGTLDPDDINYSGKSDYTNKVFDNLEAIQDHYGTEITPGHKFNKIDTYQMTRSQMNKAFEVGLKVLKEDYHLLYNSCTNLVTSALFAAYGWSWRFSSIPIMNHGIMRSNYYENYLYSKEYKY